LDEVSHWIKTENEKRMAEAEALKARLNIISQNVNKVEMVGKDEKPSKQG
jgi:hypothetical protein